MLVLPTTFFTNRFTINMFFFQYVLTPQLRRVRWFAHICKGFVGLTAVSGESQITQKTAQQNLYAQWDWSKQCRKSKNDMNVYDSFVLIFPLSFPPHVCLSRLKFVHLSSVEIGCEQSPFFIRFSEGSAGVLECRGKK